MTVGELIDKLSEMPENFEVLLHCYMEGEVYGCEPELELPEPYSQEFWETYRMADLAWQVDTWLSKTCWWNRYED